MNLFNNNIMTVDKQFEVLYNVLNEISEIPRDLFNDIKQYFKPRYLKTGDYLFKVDDNVTNMYFLTSGLARYYYLLENGKEFNKSFAQNEGHLLSSISSVISNDKSPFSVEILSDFSCLYISYDDFIHLGVKYAQWNKLILRIYENLIIKKERREEDFLTLNATQRYIKFLKEYSKIVEVVPNYHIASYLGITEVALSRIRNKLKLT